MSDTVYRVIPTDPHLIPNADAAERVVRALAAHAPDAERIEIEETVGIRFIDAGENFERVACPACGADLEMDWWAEAMGHAFASEPMELPLQLPCCGAQSSLNALAYDWPQGFARWSLDLWNPGRAPLTTEELDAVSAAAGLPLRVVIARI